MISEDVRSTKGRPSASTPVTTRGTACTIRVLRRFLNSVLALVTLSDTISVFSSAKLPPESFMRTTAAPQCIQISRQQMNSLRLLHRITLRSTFRGRPAVPSRQEHPCFFCDPHWPNQQIDRSVEKRRMVSLDPVAEKQEHPSAQKKSRSQDPSREKQKDNPGKNHRDTNAMQGFVPAGFVLVIVLRHVACQARHQRTSCQPFRGCPGFGGNTATVGMKLYTQMRGLARA